ncbi:hypothetical protein NP233_g11359 [Leucocoprinus birnbaumii]|uniref:Uncharacterized protein n=1 Tax=Leucocoprinus birnbaumii TaxID=56174 RepID=A0AAD5VGQ0_9AGAR|nr:hypothetical protein NP233_g11359 [Leucocoprinus birnbaumii]
MSRIIDNNAIVDLTVDDPLPFPDGITLYQVTKRLSVECVLHLSEAPEYWPVPTAVNGKTAYILDLRENTPKCVADFDASVDAFIKQECQDSWKGPTGSENRTFEVYLLGGVECRRSDLYCNGCLICTWADPSFLKDFIRWSSEDQSRDDLLTQLPLEARKREANSVIAQSISWYRSICNRTCTGVLKNGKLCGGSPTFRKFKKERSGSQWFIGCSRYLYSLAPKGERHIFENIPAEVRIDTLERLFGQEPLYNFSRPQDTPWIYADIKPLLEPCTNIVHPASAPKSKKCEFIHFGCGEHTFGHLVSQKCSAKLTIFIPIDKTDFRAIIIPEDAIPHSHPTFPARKVPYKAKELYTKCIKAVGTLGATTLRIDNAPSTLAILDGRLPQEVHGSLVDSRKRQRILQTERKIEYPNGSGLEGVWGEYMKERSKPPQDRYIHGFHTYDIDSHVIITLHPPLVPYIMAAQWIMADTTFKVVHGSTNEFKILIWDNALQQSDAEGAQAQGFGDMVLHRNLQMNFAVIKDSDDVLLRLWKTCIVHFDRGVQKLKGHAHPTVIEYLRSLPRLESRAAVTQYMNYSDHWDKVPNTTNPMEGSHATDNRKAGSVNNSLLEAILLAKQADQNTARTLSASQSSGVLVNSHNSLTKRYAKQGQRRSNTQAKKGHHIGC